MSRELEAGTIIAERWRVCERLGRGGYATIYRAEDVLNGFEVAVKVLKQRLPTRKLEHARQRFFYEAAAMRAIEHPSVVKLFDFGVLENNRPFLVMTLLEGHELEQELMTKGPMDPVRVWVLMMEMLGALAAGHKRGIIHKDLKPSNLFLTWDEEQERLMVLDFGLACVRKARRLTQPGFLSGTPAYLPPEYIDRNVVTPAFDVYQAGLVMVEMLTGQPVIQAKTAKRCFLAHLSGDIDASVPSDLADGQLGELISRALSHDHTERFADASEMRRALSLIDPRMLTVRRRRDFTPHSGTWLRADSSL